MITENILAVIIITFKYFSNTFGYLLRKFAQHKKQNGDYNSFAVYCRELAPGTVSLTGDRAQGDDNKHDSHYNGNILIQIYE